MNKFDHVPWLTNW